jgi:glyoxylase-like metal-dependent hydrolase (beta-lactamase superfamily II)
MTLAGTRFVEVATDIHVLRYPVLDVNSTLVVGSEIAAVIDTLSTPEQGRELLDAVRAVTDRPLVIINTHHHFDHTFGNAVIADSSPGSTIWAHEAAAAELREHGTLWQRQWYEECLADYPDLAEPVFRTEIRPANRTIRSESTMDIGGRVLELRHLGRGHTEGDLVVLVPDAGVLIAGDLVEQGSPPSFEDSYPLDWPDTVTALLHLGAAANTVVPGHGAPVDLAFVHAQHDELTRLAWLIRDGHRDGADATVVAQKAPYTASVSLMAITRGYAELDGRD